MGAGGSVQSEVINFEGQQPNEFVVALAAAERFKLMSELPPKFILQVNYESLDFVRLDSKSPIIQCKFILLVLHF